MDEIGAEYVPNFPVHFLLWGKVDIKNRKMVASMG
jgi:hypothetical protein